jgi:hypothetical protein
VLKLVHGVAVACRTPADDGQAGRLIAMIVDGLRVPAPAP